AQIEFLVEVDKLKSVLRRNYAIHGDRRENSAEHSWHVALFAMVLAEHSNEPVDINRVVRMLVIHDIVEGCGPLAAVAGRKLAAFHGADGADALQGICHNGHSFVATLIGGGMPLPPLTRIAHKPGKKEFTSLRLIFRSHFIPNRPRHCCKL